MIIVDILFGIYFLAINRKIAALKEFIWNTNSNID